MKKLLALFALALMPLLAASPDGTWKRDIGKKGQAQTLVLTSDGNKLTGTLDQGGGRLGTVNITDGQIRGSEISFKVVRELADKSKLTQTWSGTVAPFELKLTVVTDELSYQARPSEYTFYRTK